MLAYTFFHTGEEARPLADGVGMLTWLLDVMRMANSSNTAGFADIDMSLVSGVA